jgi:IS30 family transposase
MTYDNGIEMARHEIITKNTGMKIYFAHPYSSWERGTNENTNGLIRRYLPKGTDFIINDKSQFSAAFNVLTQQTLLFFLRY